MKIKGNAIKFEDFKSKFNQAKTLEKSLNHGN